MKKILLQMGHFNTVTGATGAPGEMEFNKRIVTRLSEILISKGFQLFIADANYIGHEDFDLALAVHADANIYGTGGGFIDYPDPSVDSVNTESKRIKEAMESQYFIHSNIVNHPERSNANTKFYYWWSMLTANTPCVIIETCVIQDPHDSVIAADSNIIPNAIARDVCLAFNVTFETAPVIPPAPPVVPPEPTIPSIDYKSYLIRIKEAIYGKGWWFQKWWKVKDILSELSL